VLALVVAPAKAHAQIWAHSSGRWPVPEGGFLTRRVRHPAWNGATPSRRCAEGRPGLGGGRRDVAAGNGSSARGRRAVGGGQLGCRRGQLLAPSEDRDRLVLPFLVAGWLGSIFVLAAGYAATGFRRRRHPMPGVEMS
jgi:hypothetical protein